MGFCQIFKVELILKALRNFGKSAYLHGKNLAKNEEIPCLNCLWQIFWTEKRISGTGSVIIYLPMYAFTSRLLSLTVSEKYFFAFKKQYWYFYWFFFGSMQEKKVHLLSAFLEWFSIFNYSPLLPISELVLDKKFHQNAALCIHLWKRIKSHEMKIRKSNRALTGKNFSSSLNPEILRKG